MDDALRTTRFLVDTNVISLLVRKRRDVDPGIVHFFETVHEERLYLSALTIGEIQKGIDLLVKPGDAAAHAQLEQSLELLCDRFEGRILPADLPVARQWGRLNAERQRIGKKTPVTDTLIAASAYVNQLAIASADRDFSAFADVLTLYNPRTKVLSRPT